jgi:hypothetical protein
MLEFRSQHIPSVLNNVDEDVMAPNPAVTGSSSGGRRGSGGDGDSVALPAASDGESSAVGLSVAV